MRIRLVSWRLNQSASVELDAVGLVEFAPGGSERVPPIDADDIYLTSDVWREDAHPDRDDVFTLHVGPAVVYVLVSDEDQGQVAKKLRSLLVDTMDN